MSKLEDLMQRHARAAKQDFERDGELWAPLWLIENKDGITMILAAPTMPDQDKDEHADMIRKAIKNFGGVRYAYATELWFISSSDPAILTSNVRPSECPDRREGLMIQGEDINGEQQSVFYEIKRDKDGKPSLDKPQCSDEFSGRYSDMFSVGPYT